MKLVEKTFIGKDILRAANDFAALRISIFHEFPYLYEGTMEYELDYITTYSSCPDALLFGLFDGDKMVGATTCLPLSAETPEVRLPFDNATLDHSKYLYLGESILDKKYRGQGYGKRFFEVREQHASRLNLPQTCFCSVERPMNHPLKPTNYLDNSIFWNKQGYTKHQKLRCEMKWLDINEDVETSKQLIFWIKTLPK